MNARQPPSGGGASGGKRRIDVIIKNERGLHARAAARFVKLACTFKASITVRRGGQTVSGRSIMGLMMLAAGPGNKITLEAEGGDAEAALAALARLIDDHFDEK